MRFIHHYFNEATSAVLAATASVVDAASGAASVLLWE
jgi:hypothetical protein